MRIHRLTYQSGMVLPVSLIMLLLMTLIGVSGIQSTTLEEKMASNARDKNLAFQAAESAVREGEAFLTAAILPTFTAGGVDGLYSLNSTIISDNTIKTSDFWSANGKVVQMNNASVKAHVKESPRYVIQQLAFSEGGGQSLDASVHQENEMYQITARGVGGSATAVAIIQSTYKR